MVSLLSLLLFLLVSVFAPFISAIGPDLIDPQALKVPPFWAEGGSTKHLLGTDDIGRDMFSRLIYGGRISFAIGFSVVFLSSTVGTLLGLIAGYYEGFIDRTIMRFINILMSLPSILLAIVVVSILGPGIGNAIVAVSIVAIPSFTRIIRSCVIQEKSKEYVLSAKAFGASNFRIIFKEILPNCMPLLIVQATLGFSDGILNTAALGFLGLGAQPPTPEWGTMLSDARAYIESSPWLVTLPGLCILVVVLAFNLLGDALRDILDPKLKQ